MNAQKKINYLNLELLAGGGGIECATERSWLGRIFGFLTSGKSDLTLEAWQHIERKRVIESLHPHEIRAHYSNIHRHC